MSVVDQARIGELPGSDGSIQPFSLSRTGAIKSTDRHGRYQEAVMRGNCYFAATQSGQVISTIGTAATGFTLTNPAGSQTALSLIEVDISCENSGSTAPKNIVLTANNSGSVVQTTALTVRNALIGNTKVGVGLAASSTTLPAAPFVIKTYPGGIIGSGVGSTLTSIFIKDEVAGAIVLAPGSAISVLGGSAGGAAAANAGNVSVFWEEIPYP